MAKTNIHEETTLICHCMGGLKAMAAHNQTCCPPQQDDEIDLEKYIASIVQVAIAKMQMEQRDEAKAKRTLWSILKQVNNNQA